MLVIHIVAGSLALIAGMIALLTRKGAFWHRRAGLVFAGAMGVMTSTGALLALLRWERISMIAGVLTFYLVATGLLTVRRSVAESRGLLTACMLTAFAVALAGYVFGLQIRAEPKLAGWAVMFFVFASVALLCGLKDARLLWIGHVEGASRLARHLVRMGLALFIANASFFFGQAKQLPPALRESGLTSLPVFTVVLVTLFWFVRVYWKRHPAAPLRRAAAGLPAR